MQGAMVDKGFYGIFAKQLTTCGFVVAVPNHSSFSGANMTENKVFNDTWEFVKNAVPLVDFLCSHATIVVTNVKGPQEQLYLAGAPLEGFVFWTPRYGGIGLGVSILSYAGQVRVGAISDRETVSHPESIVAGFQTEFDALLALALEEPASPKELPEMLDDALASMDELLAAEAGELGPAADEPLSRVEQR